MRAFRRYSGNRANLLAGGIAYTALFSLAAALTIGITVTVRVLGNNSRMRDAVFSAINDAVPGVLSWNGKDGLVDPQTMVANTNYFSVAGVIALVTLILSATRVMTALKSSIRIMFGIEQVPDNPVLDKLRDIAGFVVLMLAVVATGLVTTVNSTFSGAILRAIGVEGRGAALLISVSSLVLAALIDALVLAALVRLVSRVRAPWRDFGAGAAIFVVGSGVLRLVGTKAVSSVDSPLLASFAAIITVMLWVNLLARMVLLVSAFIANPPKPAQPVNADHLHANDTPNYITLSAKETLAWPHMSLTGSVDLDPERDPNQQAVREAAKKRYRKTPVTFIINRLIAHHRRRAAAWQRVKDRRFVKPAKPVKPVKK